MGVSLKILMTFLALVYLVNAESKYSHAEIVLCPGCAVRLNRVCIDKNYEMITYFLM